MGRPDVLFVRQSNRAPAYRAASSIDTLARRYEIHRTTVMHHLDQSDVARRKVTRKMTDETVALAAARYEQGASLAAVASGFGVNERTSRESSAEPER